MGANACKRMLSNEARHSVQKIIAVTLLSLCILPALSFSHRVELLADSLLFMSYE